MLGGLQGGSIGGQFNSPLNGQANIPNLGNLLNFPDIKNIQPNTQPLNNGIKISNTFSPFNFNPNNV